MTQQRRPHDDVDLDLAGRLVASQFPELAGRPLTVHGSGATDNTVVRVGRDLLVRLPRNPDAARRLVKELRWLPEIARRVSVRVPRIVGVGRPNAEYPFPWAVQDWIEGHDATTDAPAERPAVAVSLARAVNDLRRMDATAGPAPAAANAFRGVPLAELDARVRWGAAVTTQLGSSTAFTAGLDVSRVLAIWQQAVTAPPWPGPPLWVHGDLLPGNVLLDGGELAAVIDFGCAGVGDPACDGLPAWTLFTGRARAEFLSATHLDDATDLRARGWAVYVGITAAPYHHLTNPAFCALARRVLDDLLATA